MNLGVSHFGPRVAKDLGLLNLGGRHTNPQPPPQSQERSLCGVRIARARIRISRQLLILLVRVLGQAPPNLWRHLFYTISHYIIIVIIIFIILFFQNRVLTVGQQSCICSRKPQQIASNPSNSWVG